MLRLLFHCKDVPRFVHPFICREHLGCFHLWLLWIMLLEHEGSSEQVFVWVHTLTSLRCIPRSGLARTHSNSVLTQSFEGLKSFLGSASN